MAIVELVWHGIVTEKCVRLFEGALLRNHVANVVASGDACSQGNSGQ